MSKVRSVGLDLHADTIAVAVAEGRDEVRPLGVIPNRLEPIRKLVKTLGPVQHMRACYEAGPTGYVLYWQLTQLGVPCDVIALVPTKAGDRVKTDRRAAEKLARCHRAGELTAVWMPAAAHEALRDLVRAREAAKKDQLKARHRLGKFLLRHGCRPQGLKAHRPNVTDSLLRRQKHLALSDEAKAIAWKAQQRLHKRHKALAARGKNKNQIMTSLGRELLGFIWAIAIDAEKQRSHDGRSRLTNHDGRQSRWQRRDHGKENPPHVLCGTVSEPNPRT